MATDPSRPYSSDFDAIVLNPTDKKKTSKQSKKTAKVSQVKLKPFKMPEKRPTQQQMLMSMTPTAQYEEIMRLKSLTHMLQLDLKAFKQEITTRQEKALIATTQQQNEYPSHLQSLLTEIQTLTVKIKTLKETNTAMMLEQSGLEQGKSRLQADLTNAMIAIHEQETPASLPSLIENIKAANGLIVALNERIQTIERRGTAKIHEKNVEIGKLKIRVDVSTRDAKDARDKLDEALVKLQREIGFRRSEIRKDTHQPKTQIKHNTPHEFDTTIALPVPQVKKPSLAQAFDTIRNDKTLTTIHDDPATNPSRLTASTTASPTIFKPTLFKKTT